MTEKDEMNFNKFGTKQESAADKARREREQRSAQRHESSNATKITKWVRKVLHKTRARTAAQIRVQAALAKYFPDEEARKKLRLVSAPCNLPLPPAKEILNVISHVVFITSRDNDRASSLIVDTCCLVMRGGKGFAELNLTSELWLTQMSSFLRRCVALFKISVLNAMEISTMLLFFLDVTNPKQYETNPKVTLGLLSVLQSSGINAAVHSFGERRAKSGDDMALCAAVRLTLRIALLLRRNQSVVEDFVGTILAMPLLTTLPREVFAALHNVQLWESVMARIAQRDLGIPPPPHPWLASWPHITLLGNVVEMGRNVVESAKDLLGLWLQCVGSILSTIPSWESVKHLVTNMPTLKTQMEMLFEAGTVTLALTALFPHEEVHQFDSTVTFKRSGQGHTAGIHKKGDKIGKKISQAKAFFLELKQRAKSGCSKPTMVKRETSFMASSNPEAVAARKQLVQAVNAVYQHPPWLAAAELYCTAIQKWSRTTVLNGLACRPFLVEALWSYLEGNMTLVDAYILSPMEILKTVKNTAETVLILFCSCYAHFLPICNDHEFYTLQQPFSIDKVRYICEVLTRLLFRSTYYPNEYSLGVIGAARQCLYALMSKHSQREFCPREVFLVADMKKELHFTFNPEATTQAHPPHVQRILREIPFVLSFEDRVKVFRSIIENDRTVLNIGATKFAVTIRRKYVVEDGLKEFGRIAMGDNARRNLKCRLFVQYINEHGAPEAGIDAGGVFKEFLEELVRKTFGSNLGFFKATPLRELYPNPIAKALYDPIFCEQVFVFLGRVLGKALYEGVVVDIPFASFFLNSVLNRPNNFEDLKTLDTDLHRSLTQIREMEDVSDASLYFSVTEDWLGTMRDVELTPGGADIPVTNANLFQYIVAVTSYKLNKQFGDLVGAFQRGLLDIVNPQWFSMFSRLEFQQLISGSVGTHFDVDDLRRNTKYVGEIQGDHKLVKNLFEVLSEFSAEDKCKFLRFCTSCSRPPLLGFGHLHPPFSIRSAEEPTPFFGDIDRLPTSSTCFNLLKLPCYKKKSTLREKLLYAIRSNSGFDLS